METAYLLIDCNNFFASCEKVFRPDLRNTPLVVLSNNDGCIVARSKEAKAMGIPMGVPVHKCKDFLELHNVKVFSANFQLYGDISSRIMKILKEFADEMEIYSIDEAFLLIKDFKNLDLEAHGRSIRDKVLKWTGIPVSVGIAKTKTLAKIANEYSKKKPELKGVLNLIDNPNLDEILESVEVQNIWGIGYNFARFLNRYGIYNAKQFKDADPSWVRKNMSVVAQRTMMELNQIACIRLEHGLGTKKSIISSRSFSRPVTSKKDLKESVATYITRAAEKLRRDKSAAAVVYVSIITNTHKNSDVQYYASGYRTLTTASSFTPELIQAALEVVDEIYKEGYRYKKSSVMLSGIVPQHQVQINLFNSHYPHEKYLKLMNAVDTINERFKRTLLVSSACGIDQLWRMKQEHRSPKYTTKWEEVVVAKA